MTNVLPRIQFHTPGLNHNVTPTAQTTSPKDHGKIYKRQSFNSYSWLSDSSVINVYDVSSTNTRRILRNDNFGKTSRLRQHAETDIKRLPDPVTQSRASFTKNLQVQKQSHNSISLYNEHETHTDLMSFRSNNQRPRTRLPVLTAVNQKRHTSCAVSVDQAEFSTGMTTFIQWQRSLASQRINMIFNDPEAPPRTKLNLYRAERTYSSRNLMELKRKQYIQRLDQNKTAFQGNHGKYMRYINQSKTVPLPSKSGWRRPKWLPKLVTSEESAKDNSQKKLTTDKKVCFSSNVSQDSLTDKFGKSKLYIKMQVDTEMQKQTSSKKLLSNDQPVIVTKRPQGSKQSFLLSPNGSSKGPTNSRSHESTEKVEDVPTKGELKDAVEKVEQDNSDKHLSSGDKNLQRQTITEVEVDIPMSLPGHVSPKGLVNDMSDEQDFKSKDFEQRESTDEMNKKCQEHEYRMSAVDRPESRKSTFIKDHAMMQDEDQKSIDFNHREFIEEMNKTSKEHDSSLSAVESQESEKNTSSEVHENSQEKEQLTDFGESEYVDEMNKKSLDHSRPLAAESPESGKGTSNKVPVKLQEEDEKSTELEQRESAGEMNRKSQEDDNRDSPSERPDVAKKTSNKAVKREVSKQVDENLEDENRKSRPSTAKRPESVDNTLLEGKDPQTQASITEVEENKTFIIQQIEKLEK